MPKPNRPSDASNLDLASLKEAVENIFAQRPPQETTGPSPKYPQTAAENELFRAEMAYRLHGLLDCKPTACADHRCRRTRRCRELEETKAVLDRQRALVELERAAAQGTVRGTEKR